MSGAHGDDLTLITLPISHYCEKARWALDRAGLRYREEGHGPFFSRFAGRRHGVWSTVPVLVTPSGAFGDSTAILRFVDGRLPADRRLYPEDLAARTEVEALEDRFDEHLGPHTRRVAYYFLLPDRKLVSDMLAQSLSPLQEAATRALFPVVRATLRRALRIDRAGADRSKQRIEETFAMVGDRLRDGRRYLTGDRFTAADLTFAALAAPALRPARYGAKMPPFEALPAELQAEMTRMQGTPAGKFGLRLYEEER